MPLTSWAGLSYNKLKLPGKIMLSRRFATALKRQDWVTVFIEFALVLVGVLSALQLNNWNAERANKRGAISALERLQSEVEVNIAALDDRVTAIEELNDVRQAGITALQSCDTSPEAMNTLSDAIGALTSDIVPSFVDNTLIEMSRQDRYLDLMSDDFRIGLNIYSGQLSDERDQLRTNFAFMWDEHIITHPRVGIVTSDADILASKFAPRGSMDVLCKDTVFTRQLTMTVIWHYSTRLRLLRFRTWSEEFLAQIDSELSALR